MEGEAGEGWMEGEAGEAGEGWMEGEDCIEREV
jgi:hypothetical protein